MGQANWPKLKGKPAVAKDRPHIGAARPPAAAPLHLPVQELDHLAQFGRDAVGDKKQTYPARLKVRPDLQPEGLGIEIRTEVVAEGIVSARADFGATGGETLLKL